MTATSSNFRSFGAKAVVRLGCIFGICFSIGGTNHCLAQPSPDPSKAELQQVKEIEHHAKTLFGEWEKISPDADIGFSDEQVFGKGVRVAPKSFFLGDPNPGMFILFWSWNKFDGHLDHFARLAVEPPKDSLPRAFRVQTGYVTIIFHVLSTGNRAELWVKNPEIADAVYKGEKTGKIEPVFAGYYRQKDTANRWVEDVASEASDQKQDAPD